MNDEMKEKVDSLQNQLEELESEKTHIIKKIDSYKDQKMLSPTTKKRIISSTLSTILSLGILSGGIWLSKKMYDMCKEAGIQVQEYNEEYGDIQAPIEEKIVIREYEPWEEKNGIYERKYHEYDASDVDYDELAKYLLLDLSQRASVTVTESKGELTSDDLYDDTYKTVLKFVPQDSDYFLSDFWNDVLSILVVLMVLAFTASIEYAKYIFEEDYMKILKDKKITTILDWPKVFIDIKSDKFDMKYVQSDIKRLLDRYNAADRDASKIKDELANIYNKYGYILDEYKKKNEKTL